MGLRRVTIVAVLAVAGCSDDARVSSTPVTTDATTSAPVPSPSGTVVTTATTTPPPTAPAPTTAATSPPPPPTTTTPSTTPPTTTPTTTTPTSGPPSTIEDAGGIEQPASFRTLQASVAVKFRCDSTGHATITVTAAATGGATQLEILLVAPSTVFTQDTDSGTFEFVVGCPASEKDLAVATVTARYPDGDTRRSVLPYVPF